jgi:hypothetical protein
MGEPGDIYPIIVTSAIVALLSSWSVYALSQAGIIIRLPLLRTVLCLISSIYSLRGIAFIPLMPVFPSNRPIFWLASSCVCLASGLVYAIGIKQSWQYLGVPAV